MEVPYDADASQHMAAVHSQGAVSMEGPYADEASRHMAPVHSQGAVTRAWFHGDETTLAPHLQTLSTKTAPRGTGMQRRWSPRGKTAATDRAGYCGFTRLRCAAHVARACTGVRVEGGVGQVVP